MSTTVTKVYKFTPDFSIRIMAVLDTLPTGIVDKYYNTVKQQLEPSNYLDYTSVLVIKKFFLYSIPRLQSLEILSDWDTGIQEYEVDSTTT